jgi:hypothetical protein
MLCLSSCTVQKKLQTSEPLRLSENIVSSSCTSQKDFDEHEAERQEATLIDIPIPLYLQRLPVVTRDHCGNQIVLGYYSTIEPESLVNFYQNQMERQGWSLVKAFEGSEALLHFEKPTRTCSVSIRPHSTFFGKKSGADLIIYLEDSTFAW